VLQPRQQNIINQKSSTHRCPSCGETFNSSDNLENHFLSHNIFLCCFHKGCQKQFKTFEELEDHCLQLHSDNMDLLSTYKAT